MVGQVMAPALVQPEHVVDVTESGSQPVSLNCAKLGKRFGHTDVLTNVTLSAAKGRALALMGENGAGKSTLLGIFAGLLTPSSGGVFVHGEAVENFTPTEAQRRGVQIVTQELSLVPALTVWENIHLGRELCLGGWEHGVLDRRHMRKRTAELLDSFGLNISPDTRIDDLSLSHAQVVEILKIYNRKPEILLLDEPTSALTEGETRSLFKLIHQMKSAGTSIVFTTHKMNEIGQIGDDVVVLRDGRITLNGQVDKTPTDEIVRAMVGRELSTIDLQLHQPNYDARIVFESRNLITTKDKVEGVSLTCRAGEILGLAGIAGAGRTAFMECVFGIGGHFGGDVIINGQTYSGRRPGRSIAAGVAYVPQDRKSTGLVLAQDVVTNTSLTQLNAFCTPLGIVRRGVERERSEKSLTALRTRYHDLGQEVGELSGGNQQKVLLSRWLISDQPEVLLLNEPTRGIDVGAKVDIYRIIATLAERGVAVIVSSSELPELMLLCHAVAVFRNGVPQRIFSRGEFSEEDIIRVAIGEGAAADASEA
ncbi:sugar ABC transporter ATP-binding protein (plasmid) [Acidiphilium multivorum]|uniref:sugar ABC transporter ATP-binding protein n=1 Tax=Acidiphilium multivorum TaxID=62140 RepID=UPI001F4C2C7C|nr:sugar ABC transporter ATP-binding protein [Acidiphilium multivorum]UNC16506.1 sugar ABC transporter ATP-binding protein [Acidiphilium multivorum]